MIPVERKDIFESALELLKSYGERTSIRGRFVLVYLGLRKMRDDLATLGASASTTAAKSKSPRPALHKDKPDRTFDCSYFAIWPEHFTACPLEYPHRWVAPGNRYPTNTWRNNLQVQKGIGCPAEPAQIRALLNNPLGRLACPLMTVDDEGRQQCGVTGTIYRGDEHSIWLRTTSEGYQVVDLDQPSAYEPYLAPKGQRIPIFSLIPVLYHTAPSGVYPNRQTVGVPEFCDDFGLRVDQAVEMFDCDPDSPDNSEIVIMASSGPSTTMLGPEPETKPESGPLPAEPDPVSLQHRCWG